MEKTLSMIEWKSNDPITVYEWTLLKFALYVRKVCVTPHIGIPYSLLSFGLFYLVSVLFMKAPNLVNGPWVMQKTLSMIEWKSNDANTVYERTLLKSALCSQNIVRNSPHSYSLLRT